MFKRSHFTPDLLSAPASALDAVLQRSPDRWARLQAPDPVVQMAQADAADRCLLRLVACAATATLLLAVATSMA